MEKSAKRKINIFGKVCKIITTVIIVLLLIAEGAMLTGTIVMAFLPKDAVTVDVNGTANVKLDGSCFGFDGNKISLEAGNGRFKFFDAEADSNVLSKDGVISVNAEVNHLRFDLSDLIKLMIACMIKLSAVIVPLYFFKALTKAFMVCDTPFCANVIKKMRNFAIALIPSMIVSSMTNSFLGLIITNSFSIGGGGFDIIPILFVFVVFILTAIFRYGAQLQKEYDETV